METDIDGKSKLLEVHTVEYHNLNIAHSETRNHLLRDVRQNHPIRDVKTSN